MLVVIYVPSPDLGLIRAGTPGARRAGQPSLDLAGMTESRSRGSLLSMVGVPGFEPGTSSSRTMRATRLRYTPPSRPTPPRAVAYCIPSSCRSRAMSAQTSATGHEAHSSPGFAGSPRVLSPVELALQQGLQTRLIVPVELTGHGGVRLLQEHEVHPRGRGARPERGQAVHRSPAARSRRPPRPAVARAGRWSCSRRCARRHLLCQTRSMHPGHDGVAHGEHERRLSVAERRA